MATRNYAIDRRGFLTALAAAGSSALSSYTLEASIGDLVQRQDHAAPGIVTSEKDRPIAPSGIQSGDVTTDRAVVWSRCDRPSRMVVEYATNDAFSNARRVVGPNATPDTDYTAQIDLSGLPPGEQIVYRVWFESLSDHRVKSEPLVGRFRTAPRERRDVVIAFGADQCQQWGINPEWGGMKMYETMRGAEPDVFIHGGDMIYADVPLQPEVRLDDGTVWKNIVTPAKSKPAQALDDFRGNYAYNFLDENLRRFFASTSLIGQWDDHEVMNNWSPGMQVRGQAYSEKDISVLSARAWQAFFEYVPVRREAGRKRVYRNRRWGPLAEIFVLDERSYRSTNNLNQQDHLGPSARMLGSAQLEWLKRALLQSKATWKIIASDLPLGLIVPDYNTPPVAEAWSNGDGPPLGRELEAADLLSFMKRHRIVNTVWITADVHYAAAHLYSPERAVFKDFLPFWEFVAGPLNAGTWAPMPLDNTFGPEVVFSSVPSGMKVNRPPTEGRQYFGMFRIVGRTGVMTVSLRDLSGKELWTREMEPERS